jgi:hypothetical protein
VFKHDIHIFIGISILLVVHLVIVLSLLLRLAGPLLPPDGGCGGDPAPRGPGVGPGPPPHRPRRARRAVRAVVKVVARVDPWLRLPDELVALNDLEAGMSYVNCLSS